MRAGRALKDCFVYKTPHLNAVGEASSPVGMVDGWEDMAWMNRTSVREK